MPSRTPYLASVSGAIAKTRDRLPQRRLSITTAKADVLTADAARLILVAGRPLDQRRLSVLNSRKP